MMRRFIALTGTPPLEARLGFAAALTMNDYLPEATEYLNEAVSIDACSAHAWNGLAEVCIRAGEHARTEHFRHRALAVNPTSQSTILSHILDHFRNGDFEKGRVVFWSRLPEMLMLFRADTQFAKQWDGSTNLEDRTMLVHSTDGYGDTIQFCRLLPILRERTHCNPHLLTRRSLCSLLHHSCVTAEIHSGRPEGKPPDYECRQQLLLLLDFDLDDLAKSVPYLRADPSRVEYWNRRLSATGIRVGIVWQGSYTFMEDKGMCRSMKLSDMHVLSEVGGIRLYSLQTGPASRETTSWNGSVPLQTLCYNLRDFAESAGIISALDVVVTVDTAIAHLAGALGKRCYLALPKVACWRWLVNRDDSPWYPSMTLFRQERAGEWSDVMKRIVKSLIREFCPGHSSPRPG